MLALMLSLSGCTSGMSDEPQATPNAVTVTFSVVTPRPNPTANNSRATWGDPYLPDAGSDFDNLLLSDQLRAVITNNNCTEEIAVTRLYCAGATEEESAISYEFVGLIASADIETLKTLTQGKLHIMANAGTAPQLKSETAFTLAAFQPGNDFKAIPMWGVKTIDLSGVKQNERLDVGTVELLRAMAKVEVIIATDPQGTAENFNTISAINSLSINRLNRSGFLLPEDWAAASETKDVTKDSNPLRVNDSPAEATSFTTAADKKSATFYVTECLNTAENELWIDLNYNSDAESGKTDRIYFCSYGTDGKPARENRYDIRRNHLYRFTVRRNGNELAVSADVVPYESIELKPDFGLTPKPADKEQTE